MQSLYSQAFEKPNFFESSISCLRLLVHILSTRVSLQGGISPAMASDGFRKDALGHKNNTVTPSKVYRGFVCPGGEVEVAERGQR